MRMQAAVAICVLLVALPTVATASTPQNDPPLPDAGLDQTVRQGASVALDAGGSRDPDGELTDYAWRIEAPDGTTVSPECGDCARTSFVARSVGTYAVTVTVTDDDGSARSDTLYVTVQAPPEGPSVSLSGATTPTVGETTTYTASVAAGDAPVTSVTWSLDGERIARRDTGTGPDTLSRAFDSPAARTLTVTVRDENGRTATDTLDVRPTTPAATGETTPTTPAPTPDSGPVPSDSAPATTDTPVPDQVPPPSLTLDGPTTVLAGNAVDYTATTDAVPPSAAIRWNGDETGTRVTRTWGAAGTYTVAASTDTRGGTASDSLSVEVIEPSLEIEGPTELYAGITGTFSVRTDDLPDGTTLSWGDGATNSTVSRTWTDPGNYTLEVTATVRGRVVSDTHTVEVVLDNTPRNDPPRVDIRDPGDISPGEEVTLTANASDPDGYVAEAEWTPGQTVTVPESGGQITVVITVTDDDGASASDRIRLSTTDGELTTNRTHVRCFYTAPSQQERNAPSGGCQASWGRSWTQQQVAFDWDDTVGGYDVTWVRTDSQWNNETETGAAPDPAEGCMACNGLTDNEPGSNPEVSERTDPTSDTSDPLDPYSRNGETVRNDLTGDGVIDVVDWNRRFDNDGVSGSGSDDSAPGGGTGEALQGATGETADTTAGPVEDPNGGTATATDDPNGVLQGGSGATLGATAPLPDSEPPDSTPDTAPADLGGTNGRQDADTSGGSVQRSAGQSTDDYREEFTARLSI